MSKDFIKPRTARGMRDFLPADMIKREYVFNTIQDVFKIFGFEPLQTPVIELNEMLYGKYGEDAESLIYSAKHGRSDKDELSLRYDLTVPLARIIAQYEQDLTMPFKRYQLAPVFRGERPQRGRYREFYQCDADIVGISDISADSEVITVGIIALHRLGFPQFTVKINHRQLLIAMGQYSGVPDDQLPDLYRSVDKFDKIGVDGVRHELTERGIESNAITRMMELITLQRPGVENLDIVENIIGDLEGARQSINDLRELARNLENADIDPEHYQFDFTMVRGLGYYTGPIFETVIKEPNIGSIAGGGRYDGLIGLFRKKSLPTTGISLGIERIIDLMNEFNLYPANVGSTVVQVLMTVFNKNTRPESSKLAALLRNTGIRTELYMEDRKLSRQFSHADKKGIPVVATLGPDEIAKGVVTLKRLSDGTQMTVTHKEVIASVQKLLS